MSPIKFFLPWMMILFLCFVSAVASQETLPEGSGKKAVQTYCVQCHELSTVTRGAYNETDWRNNLNMKINVGATLPKDRARWQHGGEAQSADR